MRKLAAAFCAVVAIATSCGGESESTEKFLVRVDLISDAVAAVEKWNAEQPTSLIEVGESELSYFEINATPELVNIYVATDEATSAVGFVYDEDGLSEPVSPRDASGSTVKWSEIDKDIAKTAVYERVVESLPNSRLSRFVIGRDPDFGQLTYRVIMISASGGELAAYVEPSGKIIGGDLLG